MTLLEQQLRIVQSRVRTGDAARLEQSLAEAELDRGAAAQIAARQRAQELALQLKRSYPDVELMEPVEVDAPSLPAGTDAEWMQRILGHNHELELADEQYEQARLIAQRAARDRMPDPNLALRFSNNLDGNDRVVGVLVSMPIGGARRSAEQAIARGAANVAAQHARDVRLKVEADAQTAILGVHAAHAQWQRAASIAEKMAASAEAMGRGYVQGELTIHQLLQSRRQSMEAALAATTAQLDALERATRLRLDAHEIWSVDESR
jgi:cobalt-zinc-cadmium efflux system outer membrane protein